MHIHFHFHQLVSQHLEENEKAEKKPVDSCEIQPVLGNVCYTINNSQCITQTKFYVHDDNFVYVSVYFHVLFLIKLRSKKFSGC